MVLDLATHRDTGLDLRGRLWLEWLEDELRLDGLGQHALQREDIGQVQRDVGGADGPAGQPELLADELGE